jgi:protein O-GlcNAc transferase
LLYYPINHCLLGFLHDRDNDKMKRKHRNKTISKDRHNSTSPVHSHQKKTTAYHPTGSKTQGDIAEFYMELGNAFSMSNDYEQAILNYNKAIQINPTFEQVHHNLATVLIKCTRIYEAIKSYQQAITIKPDYALAITGLGRALIEAGEYEDGELCLQRALYISPNDPDTHHSLGLALMNQYKLSEAISSFKKALDLNPEHEYAHCNMGTVTLRLDNIRDAILFYQRSIEINPSVYYYFSNLLLALHYTEHITPAEIYDQHKKWSKKYELPLNFLLQPHTNERSPCRKIRIGYVSPDFAEHPVSYFFEPLLASHARSDFDVFCYSEVTRPDAMTEHLKNMADKWRDIFNKSDEDVACIIRSDRIDILVDLAGHTARNRLMVFAHKPSPVQITYLGYPDTTGLETMDYRITDSYADPPGKTEHLHSEELVRLPHSFLCYQPPGNTPEIEKPPSIKQGYITFGIFNNRSKVTLEMAFVWAKIINLVPEARIVFKFKFSSDPLAQRLLQKMLDQAGIPAEVVDIYDNTLKREEHLALYNKIDLALDTFPYNGTTTTCEALWMGVPVITLEGEVHESRVGLSLLSTIGLTELVARSKEDYISKAVGLAADIEKRTYLRSNLRTLMRSSPLMDFKGFTKNLENEYRKMWVRWCEADQSPVQRILNNQVLDLIKQGEDLFETGNTLDAFRIYQQANMIEPNNITVLNNLGVVYWHLGNLIEAVEIFSQALEIDPYNADVLSNMREIEKITQKLNCRDHKDPVECFYGKGK